MRYTTNLELPVLEDTDTIDNNFTQGNTISETLETKIGGLLDDLQALPQVVEDITTLQGNVLDINADITALDHRVDDLEDADTAINARIDGVIADKNKGTYTDENGTVHNGTFEHYVLNVSAADVTTSKERYEDPYGVTYNITGTLALNADELFNISSNNQIRILSAECMITSTSGPTPKNPLSLMGFYRPQYGPSYNMLTFDASSAYLIPSPETDPGSASMPTYSHNYRVAITIFRIE